VAGINQQDLETTRLPERAHGHPGDAGRCHRDRGDAAVEGPAGEGIEGGGAGAKAAHGLGDTLWWHGHPVLGFAEVHAGGVGVEDLEWASARWRLRRRHWGRGAGKESVWGVIATSGNREERQDSRGGGRDGTTCRLPHGIRTGPVTRDAVADSRDQPHQRAQSPKAGTVTTTHGRPTRITRHARAGPVPSVCEAAQPPKPLTKRCT